jgi:hypothetical protein
MPARALAAAGPIARVLKVPLALDTRGNASGWSAALSNSTGARRSRVPSSKRTRGRGFGRTRAHRARVAPHEPGPRMIAGPGAAGPRAAERHAAPRSCPPRLAPRALARPTAHRAAGGRDARTKSLRQHYPTCVCLRGSPSRGADAATSARRAPLQPRRNGPSDTRGQGSSLCSLACPLRRFKAATLPQSLRKSCSRTRYPKKRWKREGQQLARRGPAPNGRARARRTNHGHIRLGR